jgi:histidinol phosphatase-like enzyme (inositol monophosphatase family)
MARREPLSDRETADFVAFACRLGEVAGRAILPHFRAALDVENKAPRGSYDPVTVADRAAETAIRDEIGRVYPRHGILGEEHGVSAGADDFTWIIDPIDGTRAFILGQLHWGVLIALNDGEKPVVGVMHQPYVGETFVGSRLGAELRRGTERHALRTRRCDRLEDAVVCATDPAMFEAGAEADAFHSIARRARMRRYGGDCYSYCLLAAGLVDLVIESHLNPYDIQPLIPIIEAAGGIVTSWSGGPCYDGGQALVAGSAEIHRAALEILRRAASR